MMLRILLLFSFISPLAADPFVLSHLCGQLGNQMFEVAAATSLALDNGAVAIFPEFKTQATTNRNTGLNLEHVFWRVNTSEPDSKIEFQYKEEFFHFVEIPYKPNMSIKGFFQSEKYFKHHKEEILSLFEPNEEILGYLWNKYGEILEGPNTVGVHIRTYRTDFPNGSKFFVFLGWDYFERMIETFPEDYVFLICSDKIDLCKKNLSHVNRKLVFVEGNEHFQDLYLLSLCAHNIISNSSFSWWGAYLNKNPEKIVVAPPIWFNAKNKTKYNFKDIIPEDWVVYQ